MPKNLHDRESGQDPAAVVRHFDALFQKNCTIVQKLFGQVASAGFGFRQSLGKNPVVGTFLRVESRGRGLCGLFYTTLLRVY